MHALTVMRILASAKPSSKNICMVQTKTYMYGAPKCGRVTGHWQEEEEWPPRAAAASHSPTPPLLAQRTAPFQCFDTHLDGEA